VADRAAAPGREGQGVPVVGWIIDPSAARLGGPSDLELTPISESIIAIVSVPAWWSEVGLEMESAWVDSSGRRLEEHDSTQGRISVRLPNRYELVDSLLLDDERRGPTITGTSCDDARRDRCEVQPGCDGARFLIAGQRLWRNTSVTIGSVKAEQVEVLPNMEGIIATFANPGRAAIQGRLRVWTSEGVTELADPEIVSIAASQGEGCPVSPRAR
jgi:hypothetical protein